MKKKPKFPKYYFPKKKICVLCKQNTVAKDDVTASISSKRHKHSPFRCVPCLRIKHIDTMPR